MWKRCSACGERKSFAAFGRNRSRKDGLAIYCRICQRAYNKRHYEANAARYIEKARQRNKKVSAQLRALVDQHRDRPCLDCGIRFPVCCMQFDHVAKKRFNVGDMVSRLFSVNLVRAEIAKCEVVCANCHAIIHNGEY